MKLKNVLGMLAVLVLAAATPLEAAIFHLEYSDTAGNKLDGLLTATSNGNGTYLATSGLLTVLDSADAANLAPGVYNLIANPNPGSPATSPRGAFNYDNTLIYPGDPYLNGWGLLLFASATSEINLWGNSAGNYSLYVGTAAGVYPYTYDGPATTSITPVPEPTTLVAGALLLLPFGASTLRVLRRRRNA